MEQLSSKEVRKIIERLKSQYEVDEKFLEFLEKEFEWYISREDKVYLLKKEAKNFVNIERVKHFGLYLGQIDSAGYIRLSIEGSQLLGPFAKRNIYELNDEEFRKWIKGEEIETQIEKIEGFVIIKHGKDFYGSGKIKNYKLLNFVPKDRRINE